jgi:hypothetical protein
MRLPRSQVQSRTGPLIWLKLDVGRKYVFETARLSVGADTVLVVFDGDRGPVAANDDWFDNGGPKVDPLAGPDGKARKGSSSRLVFTPGRIAPYGIMVQAAHGSPDGVCDLYMNRKVLRRRLVFGEKYERPKPEHYPKPVLRSKDRPEAPFYEVAPEFPKFR